MKKKYGYVSVKGRNLIPKFWETKYFESYILTKKISGIRSGPKNTILCHCTLQRIIFQKKFFTSLERVTNKWFSGDITQKKFSYSK